MEEEFTGERVIPNMNSWENSIKIWFGETHLPPHAVKEIWDEHRKRYSTLASPYCQNKDVLDIACGSAYGRKLIGSRKYVGVDINIDTLTGVQKGDTKPNKHLIAGDIRNIPLKANTFDTVLSFETIEHIPIEDVDDFLSNISRVMKEDGHFIMSTPNRDITNPNKSINDKPRNKFHYFEFNREELENALKKHFSNVTLFGQRIRLNETPRKKIKSKLTNAKKIITGEASDIIPENEIPEGYQPNYWLAVCTDPIMKPSDEAVSFQKYEVPSEVNVY